MLRFDSCCNKYLATSSKKKNICAGLVGKVTIGNLRVDNKLFKNLSS